MTLTDAITVLSAVGSAGSLVSAAVDTVNFLRRPGLPDGAHAALAKLPANTPAEGIVRAIAPFRGIGGDARIVAGDNGGGKVTISRATVLAGDGRDKGGDLTLKAGDGGVNGAGGDLVIGPGVFRAGNGLG